ncbi:calcium/sodium antiporter [Pelagibius litoralis]|uniref:Calcium/sodium antiporter n=1 Tax=Pelagibius litoralis TaxID=374515 RepID=A0A967F2D2_9PROT|nr:calcium/sodium antiporter [Pelagibius litoralis]NIA71906.1 calcium/sodium antiporter [Pelagibius litoralis]
MTAIAFLQAGGGLVLLFIGGEVLLRGAVGLSLRFGLSPLLIGLTVVAFATSMPELVVTVTAGLQGATDIGVGNVVGSNVANILLILGLAALLCPIEKEPKRILRDTVAMVAATAVFFALAFMERMGFVQGIIMIALLAGYLLISYRAEIKGGNDAATGMEAIEEAGAAPRSAWVALALVVGGIVGLAAGSELLVRGALIIARAAGVSETVIGLTLVAFGTSLPELATAIVAALRGHTEVALGNVLGSNIFNILLILGVLFVITPVVVAPEILSFDIWILAAATLIAVPVMLTGKRIGRIEGAVFIMLYAAFIWVQFDSDKPAVADTSAPAGHNAGVAGIIGQ